ncbi:MAG: hypothetical protein EBU90_26045 [Proteobacteria bacterium]|nr:hypothetical protein [Pseudomonadota bacterium]
MKFYKFITEHTQTEIDGIILNLSLIESEEVERVFNSFRCIEYTNENGFECLFAILNESKLRNLCSLYDRYLIRYQYFDISKEVLFNLPINTRFKNSNRVTVSHKIKSLINDYRKQWLTTDIVLDKILELGIESLNDFDYSILKSH